MRFWLKQIPLERQRASHIGPRELPRIHHDRHHDPLKERIIEEQGVKREAVSVLGDEKRRLRMSNTGKRVYRVDNAPDSGWIMSRDKEGDLIEEDRARPLTQTFGDKRLRILVPKMREDQISLSSASPLVDVFTCIHRNAICGVRLKLGDKALQESAVADCPHGREAN